VKPKNTTREERRVDAKTVLKLNLAAGGGAAIRVTAAR
jgi:hypothetical protein